MEQNVPVVLLSPEQILVVPEDNPRFGKPANLEALKLKILEEGGINTPVEVEPIPDAQRQNGQAYRLTVGFRRVAAVTELNKEGAGLQIPAIVRERGADLARLKTQISENKDRENFSLMDTAVAIKKLFDLGVPRQQIRETFARPQSGAKKGTIEVQPASNAWVNMLLSLLQLPKPIQEKIHDGTIGLEAAYQLTRIPPDKRQAVLDRAIEQKAAALKREQSEEDKWNKAEAEVKEAETKAAETDTKIAEATKAVEDHQAIYNERLQRSTDLYKLSRTATGDAKKTAVENHKAAEKDAQDAEKALNTAKRDLEKLTGTKDKLATAAQEARKKLEAARALPVKRQGKAGKGEAVKPDKVGAGDVRKAAAAEGVGDKVPLKAGEMRKALEEMVLAKEVYPKVAQIAEIILSCFNGGPTPATVVKKLAAIVGEEASKKGKK